MLIETRERLADILGVSPTTVSEWTAAGMPVVEAGGQGRSNFSTFDSVAVIRWMIEREVRKVRGGEAPKDRYLRLQGDALEMKLATDRGELVPVASVEPAMKAAVISARERVRGEPPRIAAAMEGLDQANREALLRDLFDDMLNRLANWRQSLADQDDDADVCTFSDADERAD